MEALQLLLNRSSQPKLTAPAPAEEALENIKQAALRAPDHGNLKPWRFIVCEGKGLKRCSQPFNSRSKGIAQSRLPGKPIDIAIIAIWRGWRNGALHRMKKETANDL